MVDKKYGMWWPTRIDGVLARPKLSSCLLSYHDSWHHLEPVRGVRRTQHLIISNNNVYLAMGFPKLLRIFI